MESTLLSTMGKFYKRDEEIPVNTAVKKKLFAKKLSIKQDKSLLLSDDDNRGEGKKYESILQLQQEGDYLICV